MTLPSTTVTQQNRTSVLKSQVRAERTREAVAVSVGIRQGPAGGVPLPAPTKTNLGVAGGSSLDIDVITARPIYSLSERRQRSRTYQRIMSGVEYHHHKSQLRFLTLTSAASVTAKVGGTQDELSSDFRALKERIRRLTPMKLVEAGYIKPGALHRYYPGKALTSKLVFDYIAIKTAEGNGVIHILYAGDYLPQSWLSDTWLALHGAFIVDIRKTYGSKRGIAGYLCQYCAGQHKFIRYSWSWGWVWPGFVKSWLYLKHCWRCANNSWDLWADHNRSWAIPFVGNHGSAGLLGLWRFHLQAGIPP